MPLVKDGKVVDDHYVRLADDEAVPEHGPVLLSAERFLGAPKEYLAREAPVGILWPNARSVGELEPYIDRLALVALVFPNFKDGRAYSQARLLRERFAFAGELRATGGILRDQFLFLMRSGFDTFEVTKPSDALAFAETVARFSVFYQPTGSGEKPASQLRLMRSMGVKRLDTLSALR